MKKKLTIVYISNNYTPYCGGVVQSINTTANALRQQGHCVYIITLQFEKYHRNDAPYVIRIPALVRFMYRKNYMAFPLFAEYFLKKHILQIKPDIIHVHHPFILGIYAQGIAHSQEIPIIFTYHTIYEAYTHYIPLLPPPIVKTICNKYVLEFCKKVNHIIAPSSYIEEYLKKNNIKTPISIIPSPVREVFITHNYLKKQMSSPIIFLIVARFTKEKNLFTSIDFLSLLYKKQINFIAYIAGFGPEYIDLKEYAYHLHKMPPSAIIFIYQPSTQYLQKLYRMAHFFLFTSVSDTQAIVLAEAMIHATPVLALDGPGQRDIVKNMHNGYRAHDIHELLNITLTIIADHDTYATLSHNALHSGMLYHPQRLVTTLEALYYHHMQTTAF